MQTSVARIRGGRSWLQVAGVLIAVVLVAAGCGSSDSNGSSSDVAPTEAGDVIEPLPGPPTQGGKVAYGLEAETDGFDPTNSRWAISGHMIAQAIFDPLAAYAEDGTWAPYLAQAFEPNEDFTVWIIRLRPGIQFHNGEPLNAEAVRGAMQGIKDSVLAGAAFKAIDTIEVVPGDDLAVQVTMLQPWASFPASLTAQAGVVPAPAQLNAEGDAKANQPIGTGPFVYEEWIRDSRFVATRNPNYWMKDAQGNTLPYLEEVEFRPLPDPQSRVSTLQTGGVQMLHTNSNEQFPVLQGLAEDGEIQLVHDRGENEEIFVMLNSGSAPFDSKTARNAVAFATPYDQTLEIYRAPLDQRTDSAFGKESPYYFDSEFPEYDPERARQLVEQYKTETGEDLKFSLGTTSVVENQAIVQFLAEQYNSVGMQVDVKTTLQDQYIIDAVTGQYQANLWRQFGATDPDADYVWWHEDNIDPSALSLNIAQFANPELSAALDRARATPDPAVRAEEYATVQRIWAEETPYIWLSSTVWYIAAENGVHEFWNNPLPDANNVANIPSARFQSGAHRMTGTWMSS
jgi:ABC-type transport system substrate-binding protein